ncbi:MAG: Gfo/Idh/MocA family oxidoreductase [Candidatus Hydrogenedentes bacterium]|nr:Gfo/Idh/MocA family oxidoreductase [Candidatus Hydrogenedentota bacterium]
MPDKIRWGILSTGNIANKFASDLKHAEGAVIQAVGSRTQASADAFAGKYGIPNRHTSYEALAADPEVDVIYVGTPHNFHQEHSILALNAGKAVLCEKPFAINCAEAKAVFAVAQAKQRFIMEAMWTWFIPAVAQAKSWVDEGRIGAVRMLHANFGFRMDDEERGRLRDKTLGGGSLLDVGVYPIALAAFMLDKTPVSIQSAACMEPAGVDEQAAFLLKYDRGELAVLSSAIATATNYDAYIEGEAGMIHIHSPFWCSRRATLLRPDEEPLVAECPMPGNGMQYQALEVMRCLREGRLESPTMTHARTIEVMTIMDTIRAQWGLRYPME